MATTYGEMRRRWDQEIAADEYGQALNQVQRRAAVSLLMSAGDSASYEVGGYEIEPFDGSDRNDKFFMRIEVRYTAGSRHSFSKLYRIGPRGGIGTWDGEYWRAGWKHTWRSSR
jgi:hypothetical protein